MRQAVGGWLVAAALLSAGAGTSVAATVPSPDFPYRGPALAGDRAVWVTNGSGRGFELQSMGPDGRLAVPVPIPTSIGACQGNVAGIRGDRAGWTAVTIQRQADAGGGCTAAPGQLLLRSPAGVTTLRDADGCGIGAVALDTGRLITVRPGCAAGDLWVEDLASGAVLRRTLPFSPVGPAIAASGRYAAVWTSRVSPFDAASPAALTVYDIVAGTELYRVDPTGFVPEIVYGYEQAIDVDADGTVAFALSYATSKPERLGWASASDPRPHLLRDDILAGGRDGGTIAIAGGRIAAATRSTGGIVVDLQSRVLNRFSTGSVGRAVDFDGRRLAWQTLDHTAADLMSNEQFPFTPGTASSPFKPAPIALAAAVSARSTAKLLRGTAVGVGVKGAEVVLQRRRGGRCVAELAGDRRVRRSSSCRGRWVKATPGLLWELRLKDRLTDGTYRLRVRAYDARGTRGRSSTYVLRVVRGKATVKGS